MDGYQISIQPPGYVTPDIRHPAVYISGKLGKISGIRPQIKLSIRPLSDILLCTEAGYPLVEYPVHS